MTDAQGAALVSIGYSVAITLGKIAVSVGIIALMSVMRGCS